MAVSYTHLDVYKRQVYKFYCATDAMSCIESGDIDLAILDIMLPGTDGFEICKKDVYKRQVSQILRCFLRA